MWWVSLATLLAGGSRVGSGETDLCCLARTIPQRLPPADERLGGRGVNHQRCGQALSEVFLLRGPTLLRLLLPGRLGGVRPLPRRQGNPNYGDEPLIPRAAPHLFRRVL